MKQTKLHEKHTELGAKMVEYAGFHMPIQYEGISQEHNSVRTSFGVFDVSHMGEIFVKGPDAYKFVNYLITNEVTYSEKIIYGLILEENGYVIDDLLAYPMSEQEILLVVNASNTDKDYDWILKVSKGFNVEIINDSDKYSQIAIQGPKTQENMEKLLGFPVEMEFMTFKTYNINNNEVIISRTGYTGEDGYEIYGNHELIVALFDKVIKLGAHPCGLGSRDTLRFEAGLPLYGQEIGPHINPVEANLGFFIKFDKDFIGKAALEQEQPRKIVGLRLLERNIPRTGYKVFKDDKEIGEITTGYLLPTQEEPIAFAIVDKEYSKIGTDVFVQIRNKMVPAKIRNRKFMRK